MVTKVDTARVMLWGEMVGAVSWLDDRGHAVFEYDPEFLNKGLDVSPLHMGLEEARRGGGIFAFPDLGRATFLGLPGLLADALPDKFGNSIINAWLARQGRPASDFSPVERLCYAGSRAIGALEFEPAVNRQLDQTVTVEIAELVELAQAVVAQREDLAVEFGDSEQENTEALGDILRVGTSAGGARAKAVIAMNKAGRVVSGQGEAPAGYDYWILKFDGVSDLELGESRGYGRIEYAYHLMAGAAGIEMADCRLLVENGRAHFMTRRFDRPPGGGKMHLQSLCGLAHLDFNQAGAHSYEQVFAVMRRLRLSKAEAIQQYRRMVFNVVARNQDDHTKNIAFLMDRDGRWRLSPAFDLIYAHNPLGIWTNQHQMSVNGKRDDFARKDLVAVGEGISLPRPGEIVAEVVEGIKQWPKFAGEAGVERERLVEIGKRHRLRLGAG